MSFRVWNLALGLLSPTLIYSQPTLTPKRVGSNLELSWPAQTAPWRLCRSTDLATNDWAWVSTPPTTAAGKSTVIEPMSATRQFYQLRHRGAIVPFTTYEMEATGSTTGTTVSIMGALTSTTITPELEASGRAYVSLTATGHVWQMPITQAANALTLRHCLPDAPTGDGLTASLSLYVNGIFRQSLSLSSRHNWLYGTAGQNGQSNDPTAGIPHVFWDESRFFITGGVQPGDTLSLKKESSDTAAFYHLDCLDLEMAPPPATPPPAGTYLSVIDYGATGQDLSDDTIAITNCITAAKAANKSVWIPAGTYYQNANFLLDSVTVRGAGMWHTQLVGTVEGTTFAGNIGFVLKGNGATVTDLAIDSAAHTRRITGGKPFTVTYNNTTNWRVENVWITHCDVGFWISRGTAGTIRGCRVRQTYADGINLNRGTSDCLIEHCHIRGTGDDGIALLSETGTINPYISTNNIVRFNTVSAVWWGHNCDIAGGGGHLIEDNYLVDNAVMGGFTVNLPTSYPMYPITSALIRRNTILRTGGNYGTGQKRGAVWIFPSNASVSGITFRDNEIIQPIFRGIHIVGTQSQSLTFERNLIDSPGEDAIIIFPEANGTGIFLQNTVRSLKTGFSPFLNNGGADYSTTLTGNSWQP
jgi:hypothetical protein